MAPHLREAAPRLYELGRRHAIWVVPMIAVAAVGAGFAAVRTRQAELSYRAVARLELPHLATGSGMLASLARRQSAAIGRARLATGSDVHVVGAAGTRAVQVIAVAGRPGIAIGAANRTAAELLAGDRGVDRAALARQIASLERAARTASSPETRRRLTRALAAARARQVTAKDFQPAPVAAQATGPRPIQDPIVGALIGALAASAALAAAARLTAAWAPSAR